MIIYLILNLINDKTYVGQTTRTLKERKRDHICISKNSKYIHPLYCSMRKYGIENFRFIEITTAKNQEELDELERTFILAFDSANFKFGYNIDLGGIM